MENQDNAQEPIEQVTTTEATFDEHASGDEVVQPEQEVSSEEVTGQVPTLTPIVADGRVVFVENENGPVSPYLVTNLSRVDFSGQNLLKCYPNPDTDPVDGLATFVAGFTHNSVMAQYRDTLTGLSNVISYQGENGVRRTAISIPKPPLNGTALADEDVVLAITSSLGLGGKVQIPLVSSGFRVEMVRPTGDDVALLDEYLLRAKGEFGRLTMGASMTYCSVYLERDIINLALRMIKRTNLAGVSGAEQLRKNICQDDYPTLVLGLMAAILPEGYDVNVPCLSEDTNCKATITGTVSPARMFHVDHNLLTDYQLEVITRPISTPVTQEEKEKYQVETTSNLKHNHFEFKRNDLTYRFVYGRPTLDEFIGGGIEWANGINQIITTALKGQDKDTAHPRIVRRQLNLNTISQFAGWFKAIEVINDEGVKVANVTKTNLVIDLLKRIITDDEVSEIFDDVNKFIFNQNPTVIGVPNINCPKCEKVISPENTEVIPQDVDMLFFTRISDQAIFNANIERMALFE